MPTELHIRSCRDYMPSVRAGLSAKVLHKVSRNCFICRTRIRILFLRSSAKNSDWSELWRLCWLSDCFYGAGRAAALMAPDRFGMLLGIGIITGIITQALFNISVVISILPAKGIPLPFISYGGSSIVVTLFAVGILLNISQYAGFVSMEKTPGKTAEKKTRKSWFEVMKRNSEIRQQDKIDRNKN